MRTKSRAVSVILSLFLVVVMLVGMTPVSAISIPNTSETTDITSYKPEEFKVPDIIDEEEQAEKSYVGRVKEDEKDLYTFIFKNEDGSNTMRVFDHPVKYIDDKGETRDISLEISKCKDGSFKSTDHMIKASFGNDISEGIGLEYDDVRIEMTAKAESNEKAKAGLSDDGKKLTYAVDDKTSYVYSLTYCGIKEDIVVNEYTGQTEYEFTLDTNGLHPVKIDDSVFLADNDEEIKASIGDIIIFTADNRNNAFGELQFETVEENGEYKFTIVLDPDYLRDEKTAYPITIDPTIEINYDNNGAGAIEDVTINSLDTSSGSSGSIYVGLRNTYGIARILMRFPNLDLSGIALADNITSATVEMKDLLCETESMTVYCYIFNGSSWSESNVDWQTVSPNSYTTFLSSKTVSYSVGNSLNPLHRYSFNILNAVKGWKNGTANQSKGIIFKASNSVESGNTYINKTFASYNRATNKPSLKIEYNESGFDNATNLTLGTYYSVSIVSSGGKWYYKYTPSTTGFYTFESSSIISGDPYGRLYNNNQDLLTYNNNSGSGNNFRITYHLMASYTYYFSAGCYSTGTGSYSIRLYKTSSASYIENPTVIDWGDAKSTVCSVKQKAVYYKFTPISDGDYLFFSSSISGDPIVWLYDSNLTQITTNDDGAGGHNFRIVSFLVSGQTYYIVGGQYGSNTGTYTTSVLKSGTVLNNEYYLRNVGTLKYMDIEGPSSQEWVQQWTAHTGLQEQWIFQKQFDGYYTIKSKYGNKYYVGISSTVVGEDNIKLYSSISDNTKWNIYELSMGQLIIEPKNATGKILYSPNSSTGTNLQLSHMGDQLSNKNIWDALDKVLSYKNYYDSTFAGNSALINKISNANAFSDFVYTKYFNIGMFMDGSPTQYATVIDNCSTGTNAPCNSLNCGSDCNVNHHKNGYVVSNQLYNDSREKDHLYVLWTNHAYNTYCNEASSGHSTVAWIAVVYGHRPVIHFMTIAGSENVQLACMALNLVHETAHTLNMSDVYDVPGHDTAGTECVMELFDSSTAYAFYQDVLNGVKDPFCSSCETTMHELTTSINIPGN